MNEVLFSQTAQVYLQGQDALQPFESTAANSQDYYLGSESTNLIIRDHRAFAVRAAGKAIQGCEAEKFFQIFSQPAYIEIRDLSGNIEIDLFETNESQSATTLWLGVIHDRLLPVHYMIWHTFIPLENEKIAFAAIVED